MFDRGVSIKLPAVTAGLTPPPLCSEGAGGRFKKIQKLDLGMFQSKTEDKKMKFVKRVKSW